MKAELLFVAWPYAAVLLFGAGLMFRLARARKRLAGTRVDLDSAWALLGGSKLWRMSLVLLLLGHLLGLLLPQGILRWNQVDLRLYLLEGLAFSAGIAALGGCVGMMRRHFERSAGSIVGQMLDSIFLGSLFAAIVSGLGTAVFYRWASSWSAAILTPYIISLVSGRPAVELAAEMPFLVQLHLVSGLAVIAFFPFTSLAPIAIDAFNHGLDLALAPVSLVLESARKMSAAWLQRHNPTAWIWPEED